MQADRTVKTTEARHAGRPRTYADQAHKQAEYRRRKAEAEADELADLRRIKSVLVTVLKHHNDHIPDEGTQGIINALYRLSQRAERADAEQSGLTFAMPVL